MAHPVLSCFLNTVSVRKKKQVGIFNIYFLTILEYIYCIRICMYMEQNVKD